MRYLTVEDICGFNEAFVGPGQLRDLGLLESAVMRPQQALVAGDLYPDLHSKAAALVHSLIGNHPFVDGDKRTAMASALVFHGLNGWRLAPTEAQLIHLALDIASGEFNVAEITAAFKGWAVELVVPE